MRFIFPMKNASCLDKDMHELKFRWAEAHEIGHSMLPWHEGAMLGDDKHTLRPSCHDQIEAEANFAAARLLFLRDRFAAEARDWSPSLEAVKALKPRFGKYLHNHILALRRNLGRIDTHRWPCDRPSTSGQAG